MSIVLALRDMSPLALWVATLFFGIYIPDRLGEYVAKPAVPAIVRIFKVLFYGLLSYATAIVCLIAALILAIIMLFSTAGWHPLHAIGTLLAWLCSGSTAILG